MLTLAWCLLPLLASCDVQTSVYSSTTLTCQTNSGSVSPAHGPKTTTRTTTLSEQLTATSTTFVQVTVTPTVTSTSSPTITVTVTEDTPTDTDTTIEIETHTVTDTFTSVDATTTTTTTDSTITNTPTVTVTAPAFFVPVQSDTYIQGSVSYSTSAPPASSTAAPPGAAQTLSPRRIFESFPKESGSSDPNDDTGAKKRRSPWMDIYKDDLIDESRRLHARDNHKGSKCKPQQSNNGNSTTKYPRKVICNEFVIVIDATTTIETSSATSVASASTQVVTLMPTTVTSTLVPADVTYVTTITSQTTVTTTSTDSVTVTKTSSATATSTAAAIMVYDACQTNNYINYFNGLSIVGVQNIDHNTEFFPSPSINQLDQCCQSCQNTGSCTSFVFTAGHRWSINYLETDTCDEAPADQQIVTGYISGYPPAVVGNGICGQLQNS